MCEIHYKMRMWTMPNGRCIGDGEYSAYSPVNGTKEEKCQYLLKCALSQGEANGCPCDRGSSKCTELLSQNRSLSRIQYPNGSFVVPFLYFYYNTTHLRSDVLPNYVLANGKIKCRHMVIPMNTSITSHRL